MEHKYCTACDGDLVPQDATEGHEVTCNICGSVFVVDEYNCAAPVSGVAAVEYREYDWT